MLPSCIASNANTRPRHRTIKCDGHSPSASEMKNRNKWKSNLEDKATDTEKTQQALQTLFCSILQTGRYFKSQQKSPITFTVINYFKSLSLSTSKSHLFVSLVGRNSLCWNECSLLNPHVLITHRICLSSVLNAVMLIIGIRLVTHNLKQNFLLFLFDKG